MVAGVGVHRMLTVDLHADQIQGFFDIPVDNVYSSPVLLGEVWRQKYDDLVVVSPDVGGVVRARAIAKRLDDADLAIIDKRRPRANVSEVMNIIGEVEGKTCVLVDDMVDTAGTLCHAAKALKDHGAKRVAAYITIRCSRARRWTASRLRRSTSWWSRIRSRCVKTRRRAARSASCRLRACWLRRCAVSGTKRASALFISTDGEEIEKGLGVRDSRKQEWRATVRGPAARSAFRLTPNPYPLLVSSSTGRGLDGLLLLIGDTYENRIRTRRRVP